MLDEPKQIIKKIKAAVTDSIGIVQYDKENQPAVANLLEIFSILSHQSIDEIVKEYDNSGYGRFKSDLADLVVSVLEPIQIRYHDLLTNGDLIEILADGAVRANETASATLAKMEKVMGISYR